MIDDVTTILLITIVIITDRIEPFERLLEEEEEAGRRGGE